MNDAIMEKRKELDMKPFVIILSVIAFVCSLFAKVGYFTTTVQITDEVYSLAFRMPEFRTLVFCLGPIIPSLLMLLFALKLYKSKNSGIVLSIAMLLQAAMLYRERIPGLAYYHSEFFVNRRLLANVCLFLPVFMLFLTILYVSRAIKSKLFAIIPIGILLISEIIKLFTNSFYDMMLYNMIMYAGVIANLAMYLAIMLFLLKNTTSVAAIDNTEPMSLTLDGARKKRIAIVILSIASLVCAIVWQVFNDRRIERPYGLYGGKLEIVSFVVIILAFAFWVAYLCKLHKYIKPNIAITIMFSILAINYIIEALGILDARSIYWLIGEELTGILSLLIAVVFVFSIFKNIKGFPKAKSLVPAFSLLMIWRIALLDDALSGFYFGWKMSFDQIFDRISVGIIAPIAWILFFITIFAYMKYYKLFTFVSLNSKAVNVKGDAFSPEEALIAIKEKLELGIITEEEYKSQRNEIISKL